MIKVFSKDKNCLEESFSYKGTGNEVWDAQTFSNFWGDGTDAIAVKDISTGYGSGSSVVLRFLTFKNGEYTVAEGPRLRGHNWQCCKFVGKNRAVKKIIGAESVWTEDYSDYCAGCPSRFKFLIYTWDGGEYVKTEGGTTKSKYLGDINEMIKKEPFVLPFID